MGGMLNPFPMGAPQYKSHIHNFYFRIDLDIDGQYPHDVCEIFNHNSLNDPGGDKWDVVPKQMKLLANPDTARKWRVRSTTSKLGAKDAENPTADSAAHGIGESARCCLLVCKPDLSNEQTAI
jgi:hypothetical protein